MCKTVPKAKEEVPGIKVVLIFHDNFLRTKQWMKECAFIRSVADLPEIVSATIDVRDVDPAVMEKVGEKIFGRRVQQLAELQDRVGSGPSSEK